MKTLKQIKAQRKKEEKERLDSGVNPWLDRFRTEAEKRLGYAKTGSSVTLFEEDEFRRGSNGQFYLEKKHIRLAVGRLNKELRDAHLPWRAVLKEGKERSVFIPSYSDDPFDHGEDQPACSLEVLLKPRA